LIPHLSTTWLPVLLHGVPNNFYLYLRVRKDWHLCPHVRWSGHSKDH
jgi:hypothetical protein